jgi:hypothetical protein
MKTGEDKTLLLGRKFGTFAFMLSMVSNYLNNPPGEDETLLVRRNAAMRFRFSPYH